MTFRNTYLQVGDIVKENMSDANEVGIVIDDDSLADHGKVKVAWPSRTSVAWISDLERLND